MTKDLALLVGADQKWLTTTGFLDKIDENLQEGDGGLIEPRMTAPVTRQASTRLGLQLGPSRCSRCRVEPDVASSTTARSRDGSPSEVAN